MYLPTYVTIPTYKKLSKYYQKYHTLSLNCDNLGATSAPSGGKLLERESAVPEIGCVLQRIKEIQRRSVCCYF